MIHQKKYLDDEALQKTKYLDDKALVMQALQDGSSR